MRTFLHSNLQHIPCILCLIISALFPCIFCTLIILILFTGKIQLGHCRGIFIKGKQLFFFFLYFMMSSLATLTSHGHDSTDMNLDIARLTLSPSSSLHKNSALFLRLYFLLQMGFFFLIILRHFWICLFLELCFENLVLPG